MERQDEVLVCLRKIIRAIDLHSKRLMQEAGLSGPQLLVLRALGRCRGNTVGEVAREVHISHGTATTILDRLERKGLLVRSRSAEDRRKVLVTLTQAGAQALANAPTPLQEHFVKGYQRLAKWEQTQILAVLERVAMMMDADQIHAEPVLATQPIDQQQ